MRGAVLYGPRDVRFEERPDPRIVEPTDAIIRMSATCVCGSDLWPYRGLNASQRADAHGPRVLRHRRRGRPRRHVDQAGSVRHRLVRRLRQHLPALPGGLPVVVRASGVGHRRAGAVAARAAGGRHAGRDAGAPSANLVPSLLAVSDVLGTGWFAADAANVKPGATVVVVGDGAVGLLGVLSAKQMGAERIIAMSRHEAQAEAGARVRRDRHRDRARRRGRRAHQGADQGRRRGLGARVRRHAGVDDAGDPLHAPRRIDQLCRRPARRRARRRGAVLHARASARRPRAGAPLPSRAHRAGAERDASTPARSSISSCRSSRWPRATARWTSAARSRRCCAPEVAGIEARRVADE